MTSLNSATDVSVMIANKIYLNEVFSKAGLNPAFISIAVQNFLAGVQLLDFGNSEAAAECINSWVEENTANKIRNLIDASSLTNDISLLLINAIYFKGTWANPFSPVYTRTDVFYVNDTNSMDVEMMYIKDDFYYKNDKHLDAKFLQLPYKNPGFSLLVILPNKRSGITKLEKKLLKMDLTKISLDMRQKDVKVYLPKFKIEATTNFKQVLTELRLGVIFDRNAANFSQVLSTKHPVYVSDIVQKTFIDVNEEGTEAAAACHMVVAQTCILPPPKVFKADHPFIIVLQAKHDDRANILFLGRISEPKY